MKLNIVLFICNIRYRGYGQRSFLQNLLDILVNKSNFKVTLVYTDHETIRGAQTETSEIYNEIYIPKFNESQIVNGEKNEIQQRISKYVIDHLNQHILSNEKCIFILNSVDYLNIGYEIRQRYTTSQIIYIHHSFTWKYFFNIIDSRFLKLWNSTDWITNRDRMLEVSKYQKEIADLSDITICVTHHARTLMESLFNINSKKIRTIYNGVSIVNEPINETPSDLRLKYGFKEDDFLLIYSGRISEDKGIGCLILALVSLLKTRKNVYLILMGDGSIDRFLPLANPFWKNVILTGNVNQKIAQEFYRIGDVGIIPSLHEQCSFTSIEMRFCGLPMIVTDVDGLSEMFDHEKDAIKIPIHENIFGEKYISPEEMANAIELLLVNPILRKTISEKSKQVFFQQYTIDNMCDQYLKIFEGIRLELQTLNE